MGIPEVFDPIGLIPRVAAANPHKNTLGKSRVVSNKHKTWGAKPRFMPLHQLPGRVNMVEGLVICFMYMWKNAIKIIFKHQTLKSSYNAQILQSDQVSIQVYN